MGNSNVVKTPEFRANYPVLFKPRKNDLNGKEEFSILALFPKNADFTVLKEAAKKACEKKWGKNKADWPEGLRTPFRDQRELAKTVDGKKVQPEGTEAGAIFMNFRTKDAPTVVNAQVVAISDPAEIYSGMWGCAAVAPSAYDARGNKGVTFYLQMFQKTRDDKTLAGRPKPEEMFVPITSDEGGESEVSANDASDIFS
jgi:hypothetical protein